MMLLQQADMVPSYSLTDWLLSVLSSSTQEERILGLTDSEDPLITLHTFQGHTLNASPRSG